MNRPLNSEYQSYYETYISKVKEDDALSFMEEQLKRFINLFKSIPKEKENYSYAAGKWNIKEVLGHITDSERVFAYRALCIARGEKKSLPGFDQNEYAEEANFNERKLQDMLNEFRLQRESNIILFKSFSEDMLNRLGTANEKQVTVRALLFIIAGHAEHHFDILKTRYLADN